MGDGKCACRILHDCRQGHSEVPAPYIPVLPATCTIVPGAARWPSRMAGTCRIARPALQISTGQPTLNVSRRFCHVPALVPASFGVDCNAHYNEEQFRVSSSSPDRGGITTPSQVVHQRCKIFIHIASNVRTSPAPVTRNTSDVDGPHRRRPVSSERSEAASRQQQQHPTKPAPKQQQQSLERVSR